jgi:hypothetical protein
MERRMPTARSAGHALRDASRRRLKPIYLSNQTPILRLK